MSNFNATDEWIYYKPKNDNARFLFWKLFVQADSTKRSIHLYKELSDILVGLDVEYKFSPKEVPRRTVVIYPKEEDEAIEVVDKLIPVIEKDKYSELIYRGEDEKKLILMPGLAIRYELTIKPHKFKEFYNKFIEISKEFGINSKQDFIDLLEEAIGELPPKKEPYPKWRQDMNMSAERDWIHEVKKIIRSSKKTSPRIDDYSMRLGELINNDYIINFWLDHEEFLSNPPLYFKKNAFFSITSHILNYGFKPDFLYYFYFGEFFGHLKSKDYRDLLIEDKGFCNKLNTVLKKHGIKEIE